MKEKFNMKIIIDVEGATEELRWKLYHVLNDITLNDSSQYDMWHYETVKSELQNNDVKTV